MGVLRTRSLRGSPRKKAAPKPTLRLHHFEHHTFGAAGEPVRLALAIGGIEFEDHRVARGSDEWQELKGSELCPFHQFPVLQADGVKISQSNSILRYVGLLTGLFPKDDILKASKVDEILGTIQDIKVRMLPSLLEQDEEKKTQMRRALAREKLPWWFKRLQAQICLNDQMYPSDRGFCVGERITIADLALVCFLGWFKAGAFVGIQDTLLEDYPRLRRVLTAVANVPQVYSWRQANPTVYYDESEWMPAIQGLRPSSEHRTAPL
mmetsp:Transcript_144482/g.266481  ORF Transcript_144482/g.266481 Transcript_144482/m.266481 type:complete len:265 (-) Transcript_144482:60-854(-)